MRTDSRGRRLRFERSPKDKSLALQARDLAIFEAIHRHGPLPSNYLFPFTREYSRSELHLKHRLTKLYHGLSDGPHFLDRPPQQYQSFMARAQSSIYDLAPPAKVLLAEAGRLSRYVITRTDPFLHRLMSACVSASVELACRSTGIRYIHRHDIFSHSKCPEQTRCSPNPLSLSAGGKRIVPDDLFGIDYGGKFRFFAVEIDRNTESIERRNVGQTAFGKKLNAYGDILERGTFRDVWGIPNILILTVTTNATHMANMLAYASAITTAHQQKFLFKAKPGFGMNWTVPAVMDDLVTTPWARVLAPLDISQA
jgi:hypothetical protein